MEALFNFFKPKSIEQKRIDCFQRMMDNQKMVIAAAPDAPKSVEVLKEDYKVLYEQCKDKIGVPQDPR